LTFERKSHVVRLPAMTTRLHLLVAAFFAFSPSVARADSEEPSSEASAEHEHEHEHRFHLGVVGSAWYGLGDGGAVGRYGPGAFLAISVIPHWLELTPFVRVLWSKDGVTVPVDLLAEVPFHVTHWFHPFIAVGPTVAPTFSSSGTTAAWGGASAIGAHFYVSPEYALVVEANYNLLDNQGVIEHEVGGTLGALVAF
jgi:hypothetical protein